MEKPTIDVSSLGDGDPRGPELLALRFPYNPRLVGIVKAALWAGRRGRDRVGGWSPAVRCWLVERPAWPTVRQALLDAGCQVRGAEAYLSEPKPKPKRTGFF